MDSVAPSSWVEFWSLDQRVTFLNHGAFGAVPLPVLDAQQQWRKQLEQQPLRFFMREFEPLLDKARSQVAAFVGADSEELVFVPNATTGVNAVLRSLSFQPGDELLTTNLEYNACRNALNFVASRTGATVVVAQVPFPLHSPDEVINAVLAKVSPKTRLALLDHVTSQTALVLPIQQLVSQLTQRGVDTLVDGAHAPGMLPLNLHEIGATYYTGNCHKWLCAPKGAAFLYVQRHKQSEIRPLTISHGANSHRTDKSRFQLEFDWMGSDDPSAYLCVPEAIAFLGSLLPGGWLELMAKNHSQALAARQLLCEKLGVLPPCPEEMIGSMAVVPLPDVLCKYEGEQLRGVPVLQDILFERFNIEVPINYWSTPFKLIMRMSAQLYNCQQQYEYLADALLQLQLG
ncbi:MULTISPECIES: aminotransferase class V-fold PLP-dependent enzyme [unclassified Coleofasciculus]|uniref:aminotransferase class V-fold PLP-dependent enzyme n=1 Tax=unclassified Coleofasciculus TaxID=2692782 RepID=UPI0018824E03|nr:MULTISPECIES: aminotransferase class V-fold PLP-dependent enzyme [unclassified Coleofasciculus]MBE9129036.1 aminotransferase class V-fold PLP-dependent enzyme [Coleofasciculus sp. LEGE 07081]MBE9151641.1 aminotransferase class V-fold PLP-dependent enzyme [Coleofasciculus sp. LEGE 07092]